MKISATIITFNEEHNIARAIKSLTFADEVIVVDSESTDRTVEIARQLTDRVFVRSWPGYSAQKNFAAEQSTSNWIFSLDADEEISEALAREILRLKGSSEISVGGFRMPRRTFYLGRWIRHSGWYPDYKVRLYDRTRGRWVGDYVHEALVVDGPIKVLKGDILHYTVRDAAEHHSRLQRYTSLAAQQAYAEGKQASVGSIFLAPLAAFIRSYLLKLGFLDGVQGLIIAQFAAHYAFLKTIKLREYNNKKV